MMMMMMMMIMMIIIIITAIITVIIVVIITTMSLNVMCLKNQLIWERKTTYFSFIYFIITYYNVLLITFSKAKLHNINGK